MFYHFCPSIPNCHKSMITLRLSICKKGNLKYEESEQKLKWQKMWRKLAE